MQSSGLADTGADLVIQAFGPFGPRGALLGIVLATIGLLTIITNNAAAVLMFPIAMSTAAGAGYDPRAFAIALAIAASASFMTPIAYQTNLMVYGPGGYRFTDYTRMGLPLAAVVIVGLVLLVPLFWPL